MKLKKALRIINDSLGSQRFFEIHLVYDDIYGLRHGPEFSCLMKETVFDDLDPLVVVDEDRLMGGYLTIEELLIDIAKTIRSTQ